MPLVMHWWKQKFDCPTCKTKPMLLDFYFSADGEIRLTLICVKCNKELVWLADSPTLVRAAYAKDIELYKIENALPALPALPAPVFTEQDLKELHALGILDEEGG